MTVRAAYVDDNTYGIEENSDHSLESAKGVADSVAGELAKDH